MRRSEVARFLASALFDRVSVVRSFETDGGLT